MTTMKDILDRKGYTFLFISPDDTVFQAVKRLNEKQIGALLVMDGERLMGIFSERDLLRLMDEQGSFPMQKTMHEVMTNQVYGVKLSTPVDDCMALMTEKKIRHVPVMDGKMVVGVVSNRDVVREAITDREILLRGMEVLIANHEFPT
jgi:CBS domain-containing protein